MTHDIARVSVCRAACRVWAVAVLFAAASNVQADCVDGTRKRTAEEQSYAAKLGAALKAAMPAAPAPLALEREPQVIRGTVCEDTPVGHVSALAKATYAASALYSDKVDLTIRVNYAYPGAKDEVLGTLPKKPAPFKVHNLVISVEGHNPKFTEAIRTALDRARLQALIDAPLPDTPPAPAWTVAKPGKPADEPAQKPTDQPTASSNPAKPAPAAPAAQQAQTPDPKPAVVDQAKDAVNKLRGLFGR
jgi:hypothetical protein